MDNWNLLNDDAKNYFFSKKHLARRAKNAKLKDYLSIKQICMLLFPSDAPCPKDKKSSEYQDWRERNRDILDIRLAYRRQLINDCKNGSLKYEGNIDGWEYPVREENPYPNATKGKILKRKKGGGKFHRCRPYCCTVHKDEFKRYLERSNNYPVDSVLANWWLTKDELEKLNSDVAVKKVKKRKRITDNLTDLIYEIFDKNKIKKSSQLKPAEAWNLIVSGGFKSNLIKSISVTKNSFTLNEMKNGKNWVVERDEFLERYRKQFK